MQRLLVLVTSALVVPATASASVTVTTNAQRPALRVDARGYAEVSWSAAARAARCSFLPRAARFPAAACPAAM